MVFKALSGGIGGDLNNTFDDYGFFNDTVLVLDDGFSYGQIKTYEGDDFIYTARAQASTSHTIFSGSGNDRVAGGLGSENVFDGSGNDSVQLGANNDTVNAGLGNDVYDGGAGIDMLSFLWVSNDGFSGLEFNFNIGVKVDLALTTAQNFGGFGIDRISGFENATGGIANDRLLGTSGINSLVGAGGNDFLDGRAGNDFLFGTDGSDTMVGGLGGDVIDMNDVIQSLIGRDVARYTNIIESGLTAAAWDTIVFFDKGGLATDDKIDLSAIDANPLVAGNQAFVFRGAGAFTAVRGEVRLVVSGADTFVHIDNDIDAAAEMVIKVAGVTGLVKADFIL